MRIISGRLKGRHFNSVPGHRTHPMSEKARGALFNALGDIDGLSVLDAYGGTGALAFEAISRGAASAVILELDKSASRVIKENIFGLQIEDAVIGTHSAARGWSRRNSNKLFDLVFLDPPYDQVQPKELISLTKHAKQGGVIVISLPPDIGFRLGESRQQLMLHKNYGDAELFFYRQL